jgi:hypothetical protein
MDAEIGIAALNSAEVPAGTYWILCEITDGGATKEGWSEGTITFLDLGEECHAHEAEEDCNANSVLDACELEEGLEADCNANGILDACDISGESSDDRNGNEVPDECEKTPFHRGDVDQDGAANIVDAFAIFDFLFLGGETPACMEAADANNDARVEISDGIQLLGYLFLGSASPAVPGPPPAPCGLDPDPLGGDGDAGCEAYEGCAP